MNALELIRSLLNGTTQFNWETIWPIAVLWFIANLLMFLFGWRANYVNTRAEVDFAYFGWTAETRARYWLLSVWWDEFHRWPNEQEWKDYFNAEQVLEYYAKTQSQ